MLRKYYAMPYGKIFKKIGKIHPGTLENITILEVVIKNIAGKPS